MMINRHNYEEYFILYLDNELSPAQRREVEEFTAIHPDLKEELELLMQFKLEPDVTVQFSGKDLLYKSAGSEVITMDNYEEWLVQYADDELTPAQQEEVNRFISDNPALEPELALFRLARLQPETMVFENKEMLYRRESKERPLFPLWKKLAAAAAILLFLLAGTYYLQNRKNGNPEPGGLASGTRNTPAVQGHNSNEHPQNIPPVAPQETPVKDPGQQLAVSPSAVNPGPRKTIQVKQDNPVVQEPQQSPDNNHSVPVYAANDAIPTNNLPRPAVNPDRYTGTSETELTAYSKPVNHVTIQNPRTSDIITAVYPGDEPAAGNDGKKNKLRGFFRTITRTFEKKTNLGSDDDDNKLLVAGLAIKLK